MAIDGPRWSGWAPRSSCATAAPAFAQGTDPDGDGLPSAWETQFGLNPASAAGADGASGDPDGDGITNAQELAGGTHPRGTTTRIFAEGATGSFFDTRIALFNADLTTPARTLVRYLRSDGVVVPQVLTLLPGARVTLDPETLAPLASARVLDDHRGRRRGRGRPHDGAGTAATTAATPRPRPRGRR